MSPRSSLGDFERNVLWAISRLGSNAYGTNIIEEVETIIDREASVGALYTSLKRLEQKSLVTSKLGDATPERGGRAKRYFNLTAAGERSLRDALEEIRRLSTTLIGIPEAV